MPTSIASGIDTKLHIRIVSRGIARDVVAVFTLIVALGSMVVRAQQPEAFRAYAPAVPPGRTDFDALDRLAITHVISAYALAYDTFQPAAFLDLFTADAVFVAGFSPGKPPRFSSGNAFRVSVTDRLAAFKRSGDQRRHLMSNIVFLEQTGSTAHVSVVGLLANVHGSKAVTVVTTLNYEGWLVKRDGVWRIQRWQDFPDAEVF